MKEKEREERKRERKRKNETEREGKRKKEKEIEKKIRKEKERKRKREKSVACCLFESLRFCPEFSPAKHTLVKASICTPSPYQQLVPLLPLRFNPPSPLSVISP